MKISKGIILFLAIIVSIVYLKAFLLSPHIDELYYNPLNIEYKKGFLNVKFLE
ncbi:hypothetical protein [Flavobacterium sp.]|uniref:hypothetical protein n=1 Tax=Flavobacterium sp. TaxID=239 RepID=UPI0025BAE8AB|nr:hypothetical protein [Flavobacterium sp.]